MEKLESQCKRADLGLGLEAQVQALKHGVGGNKDVVALGSEGLEPVQNLSRARQLRYEKEVSERHLSRTVRTTTAYAGEFAQDNPGLHPLQ